MAWSVGEKRSEVRRTATSKVVEMRPSGKETSGEAAGEGKPKGEPGKRDLAGGMEMLELDFLLGVIEDTRGADRNDVAMRRLSFDELLRREQQKEIDSGALTVYAVDERNLYGKTIQCEAMKELTKRTGHKSKGSG